MVHQQTLMAGIEVQQPQQRPEQRQLIGSEQMLNELADANEPNSLFKHEPAASSSSFRSSASLADIQSVCNDFYLPQNGANGLAPAATRCFISQDNQSDDLLYHDEISDHNDCCSDHYDQQPGSRQELAAAAEAAAAAAHSNGYPADMGVLATGSGGGPPGGCYMNEYEYENISTIRHYPLPVQSQLSGADGGAVVFELGGQPNGLAGSEPNRTAAPSSTFDETGNCQPPPPPPTTATTTPTTTTQQQQPMDRSGFIQDDSLSAPVGHLAAYQQQQQDSYSALVSLHEHEQSVEHADHEEHNLLHNALMRSPEKLKLIDSIITLLNYASNYNQKMLASLLEIKRCIERDLEVVLSDTTLSQQQQQHQQQCCADRQRQVAGELEGPAQVRDQQIRHRMAASSISAVVATSSSSSGGNGGGRNGNNNSNNSISDSNNKGSNNNHHHRSQQLVGADKQCNEMIVSEI